MKKLSQTLAMAAIVVAPLVASSTAFATSTCPIGYTGPDSSNICTSEIKYTCIVNNETNIATVTNNDQTAISGGVQLTENSGAGSGSSGSATNSNNVTFNVTVTNNTDDKEICAVVATIPATPVTPVTPVSGGGQVTAPVKKSPTALPVTSGDATSNYLAFFAAALGIGAVVSYLATMIYRRQQS